MKEALVFNSSFEVIVTFSTNKRVTQPKSSLTVADTSTQERYPYSGQSFDGCRYTTCPIEGSKALTYAHPITVLDTVSTTKVYITHNFDRET